MTHETINIPTGNITQSPFNRTVVRDDYLEQLAADIKVRGILQALTVREVATPDGVVKGRYQLIIGEHRWRAAMLAGLETVPCRMIEAEDKEVVLLQRSENVNRKHFNALDEAASLQHLVQMGMTPPEIAKELKKSVAYVYATLTLNECSNALRDAVRDGRLSGSHAVRLQTVDESEHKQWIQRIVDNNISVRELEDMLKRIADSAKGKKQREKMKKHAPKAGTKLGQLKEKEKHEQAWRLEVAKQILAKIKTPSGADIADLTKMELSMVSPKTVQQFKPKNVGQKIALALFDSELSGWNKPTALLSLAKRYRVDVKKVKKSMVKQSLVKKSKT
jgi:ParB family chromosome partitioning protein